MNYLIGSTILLIIIAANIYGILWLRRQHANFKEIVFSIRAFRRFAKSVNFGARQFNKIGFNTKQAVRAMEDFRKAFSDLYSYPSHVAKKRGSQIPSK